MPELETRLATIQQEFLSRTRLINLISTLNLYPQWRAKMPQDAIVDRLRRDIHMEFTGTDVSRGPASTIGVKVVKANSISTAYTLNAQLATAPATGVIWTVDAVALTTGIQALTAAGVYGSSPTYSWTILIPDTLATASAIDNVVQFSAVGG